jgi:hypothetical protein
LDYWNSQQVGIGSCSALPSHWPSTETIKKQHVIKMHQNGELKVEFTLLQALKA